MQAIGLVAKELGKTDPVKALQMLKENQVRDLGKNLIGMMEVKGVMTSSINYQGNSQDLLGSTLKAAAKVDPQGTLDFLVSAGGVLPRDMSQRYVDQDDTSNNGSLARRLYKEWATRDAKAAATWLAAQSGTKGMEELVDLVSGPLMSQKGQEGRDFLLSLPEGQLRQQLIGKAAVEWAIDDAPAALNWVATHGGDAALTDAFRGLSERNAVAASQQFTLLPAEIQTGQLQSLTDALGRQKPLSLPAFLGQLPETQQASVNLREAITEFARLNITEASSWLNQLPPTQARDSGVSGLVDYLISGSQPDPEAAAFWAAASADPAAQARRLQRVAKAWQKQDPTGAADAIKNSQLKEPVQQQLLQSLNVTTP